MSEFSHIRNRRNFLADFAAAVTVSIVGRSAAAVVAPRTNTLLLPKLSVPWAHATHIIGGPDWFAQYPPGALRDPNTKDPGFNDFCLISDKTGRWHCIGISAEDGRDNKFFHGVSDRPDGHYLMRDRIGSGVAKENTARRMWAPFALWKDATTALLFYAHLEGDPRDGTETTSIRVLESRDPALESWQPLQDERLSHGNIVFSEHYDRDPMILWDDAQRCYFMYYVVGDGWRDPEASNVIRVRRSSDLLTWGLPKTIMAPPPGYRAAESVFVLKRNGYYYLWVCGFDYGRMSLYISEDPEHFGDPVANRIMEQSGHSPEIIQVGGTDLMACVSIASTFGNRPGARDLHGVYIQPLTWAEADADVESKIVRASG